MDSHNAEEPDVEVEKRRHGICITLSVADTVVPTAIGVSCAMFIHGVETIKSLIITNFLILSTARCDRDIK